MQCPFPRTVGFQADGKTLAWSPKQHSKQFATFQLPCGQCLACRLDYARQWAIRCVHESKMHERNSFVTLTYSDENLKSPKLIYSDFQKFMKKLRKLQNDPIGVFVTGEYGEKTKRPHWHAIIFNWEPNDRLYSHSNLRGDKCYTSETLTKTWGHGRAEMGSVTFESAGYCARYAAKKLVHGRDEAHEFHPISKKSSKHAIGKKFLERYWPDVFNHGHIVLDDGNTCSIPRYYEKWFKENHPEEYLKYVFNVKVQKSEHAISRAIKENNHQAQTNHKRNSTGIYRGPQTTPAYAKTVILKSKFKLLQDSLKL